MNEDIKVVISDRKRLKIQYVNRQGNMAAQRLAKYALECDEELVCHCS